MHCGDCRMEIVWWKLKHESSGMKVAVWNSNIKIVGGNCSAYRNCRGGNGSVKIFGFKYREETWNTCIV